MQIDRPITIAVALFIIILMIFFLVAPEYKAFGKLQTDLAQKNAEYNAEFEYYNAIANTYANLQSRKAEIQKIDDALPQDSNLGGLVYAVQKMATENGIILKSLFLSKSALSSAQDSSNGAIKDLFFSINLVGDYASLEKFIIALEKSSRIFEVTNISFGSGSSLASLNPQPQTQQMYNFSLQVKTHSY